MKWKTVQRKISDLVPHPKNPRQMTEKQVADLTASLKKFDLVEIPAINTDGQLLSGHQRLKVLTILGRGDEVIDVRMPTKKLSPELCEEYLIRANRNNGEWDFDLLANGFEVDALEEWGFDEEELDIITGSTDQPQDIDEAPEPPKKAKTKSGELYRLGDHRLLCGDATSRDDVGLLMGGEKADMVFTDPPYGVSYSDKNTFLNAADKGNCNQTAIRNDDLSEEEVQDLWFKSFEIIRDNLADVNSYYITGPQSQGMMMMMMMMKAELPYRHVVIWVKNNHVLGRCDYNYKHEPLFFGWTTRHTFYGRGEFKTSIWEVDKPHASKLHPTMKPVRLIENALKNSTERSMICLDPFMGSGSTLIACEQTSRRCFGLEIDPLYCDVIITRWQDLTGDKAERINT